MCNRISNHRLVLTREDRIQCEKCWMMWDLTGVEIVPVGYESWGVWQAGGKPGMLTESTMPSLRRSGMNTLSARDVARVLAENLIHCNHLSNVTEIHALRQGAAESPDLFIEEILGCSQP